LAQQHFYARSNHDRGFWKYGRP